MRYALTIRKLHKNLIHSILPLSTLILIQLFRFLLCPFHAFLSCFVLNLHVFLFLGTFCLFLLFNLTFLFLLKFFLLLRRTLRLYLSIGITMKKNKDKCQQEGSEEETHLSIKVEQLTTIILISL